MNFINKIKRFAVKGVAVVTGAVTTAVVNTVGATSLIDMTDAGIVAAKTSLLDTVSAVILWGIAAIVVVSATMKAPKFVKRIIGMF